MEKGELGDEGRRLSYCMYWKVSPIQHSMRLEKSVGLGGCQITECRVRNKEQMGDGQMS